MTTQSARISQRFFLIGNTSVNEKYLTYRRSQKAFKTKVSQNSIYLSAGYSITFHPILFFMFFYPVLFYYKTVGHGLVN